MQLQRIEIRNFRLSGKDLIWEIQPDASILVGKNGTGKTTVLRLIAAALKQVRTAADMALLIQMESISFYFEGDKVIEIDGNGEIFSSRIAINEVKSELIETFDVPHAQGYSILDGILQILTNRFLLFQSNLRKDIDALYTKKHKFSAKEIEQIEQNVAINNERRERFEATINHFFADSDKVLGIEEDFIFILNNELPLPVTALSSGEKQLLLILLKVFLENEQPSLLLLDEPEISLHTYWQRELLTQIRNINPHCQLLVVTHSGSLLGRGWMENFVRIEEIVFPYRTKNANISPLTIRNNEKMKRIISELNSFKGEIFERSSLFNEFLKKEKDFNAKEASELLEALRTEGIIPNRLTYLELIKKMEWTEAKSFLVNIGEDIYYLNLMLKKAPNFSISIKFFEETTKNSLKPDIKLDIILFNTLFSKTTNLAECLKLEALRKAYNIPVDELYKQKLSFKNIPLTI